LVLVREKSLKKLVDSVLDCVYNHLCSVKDLGGDPKHKVKLQKEVNIIMNNNGTPINTEYFANLIADAEVQKSSRYFEAGIYQVEIDDCKFITNSNGRPRAVVECTVIDSSNANFPPTSSVSWVVALDGYGGSGALKAFICDCFGSAPQSVTQQKVMALFSPDANTGVSVASGTQAIVNAYEKPTKAGGIFTKCMWKGFDPKKDTPPNFQDLRSRVSQPEISVAEAPTETIPF
jgi:hypothetical protein